MCCLFRFAPSSCPDNEQKARPRDHWAQWAQWAQWLAVAASWASLSSSLEIMQHDRQPRSGLATIKRDFSSKTDTPPAPAPGPPTAPKRSALSDTLRKAIQDGIASRESDKALASSQKRALSPGAVPPPQKRQPPRSWGDFEPSSSTFPRGSSQSSLYFNSRSSMSSVPPSDMDMSSHDHEEPGPHSVPPFEIKPPVQRPGKISLSDEQKNVLELVMEGTNIFYTGSAGVSFLSSYMMIADPIIVCLLRHALKDRHLSGVAILSLLS